MDFGTIEIGGVPVMALIVALVALCREWFGLRGNALRMLSAGLGVLFGVLYQFLAGWPADAEGWVVFGVQLLYGVIASGLVDITRDIVGRAASCSDSR